MGQAAQEALREGSAAMRDTLREGSETFRQGSREVGDRIRQGSQRRATRPVPAATWHAKAPGTRANRAGSARRHQPRSDWGRTAERMSGPCVWRTAEEPAHRDVRGGLAQRRAVACPEPPAVAGLLFGMTSVPPRCVDLWAGGVNLPADLARALAVGVAELHAARAGRLGAPWRTPPPSALAAVTVRGDRPLRRAHAPLRLEPPRAGALRTHVPARPVRHAVRRIACAGCSAVVARSAARSLRGRCGDRSGCDVRDGSSEGSMPSSRVHRRTSLRRGRLRRRRRGGARRVRYIAGPCIASRRRHRFLPDDARPPAGP